MESDGLILALMLGVLTLTRSLKVPLPSCVAVIFSPGVATATPAGTGQRGDGDGDGEPTSGPGAHSYHLLLVC